MKQNRLNYRYIQESETVSIITDTSKMSVRLIDNVENVDNYEIIKLSRHIYIVLIGYNLCGLIIR